MIKGGCMTECALECIIWIWKHMLILSWLKFKLSDETKKIEFIYCWLTCLICVEKSFFQGEGLSKVEIQHDWYFTERPGALPTYMSHFSYACKTEGENGISHLISALCVNCLSAIPEYSRIIDNSIIWMCIWCGLLQKLHKIKKSEHLNSKVSFKL